MTRFRVPPRVALAAGALLALLGAGCTKKPNTVDPNFLSPEGTPSSRSLLVVTQDFPQPYDRYFDLTNDGLTPDDVRDPTGPFLVYASGPGAVVSTIIDSTLADTYQLLRREANGGYRTAQDFVTFPSRRWIDTGWEGYRMIDTTPSGFQPPTYEGRGLFQSRVTTASPLSNVGLAAASGITNIAFNYQGLFNTADQQRGILTYNPPDSINFSLKWTAVAGAAGYWISIFQFTGDAIEALRAGLPAPVYLGRSRDFLLVYVAGQTSSYTLTSPPTGTVMRTRPLINKQYYEVKITAVGGSGEILGTCFGDNLAVLPGGPGTYQGQLHNTWNVILPYTIQLRPGSQPASAPDRVAESPRSMSAPAWAMARRQSLLPP